MFRLTVHRGQMFRGMAYRARRSGAAFPTALPAEKPVAKPQVEWALSLAASCVRFPRAYDEPEQRAGRDVADPLLHVLVKVALYGCNGGVADSTLKFNGHESLP